MFQEGRSGSLYHLLHWGGENMTKRAFRLREKSEMSRSVACVSLWLSEEKVEGGGNFSSFFFVST